MRTRASSSRAVGAGVVVDHPAAADKNKPGLFDFESWKTPQGHQRDRIKQLEPGQLDLTPAGTLPPE